MEELKVLALTHKHLPLQTIGKFHLSDERREQVLNSIKDALELDELIYLSTCNRIEFIMSSKRFLCGGQIQRLLSNIQPQLDGVELREIAANSKSYQGKIALNHLFEVAASLDSMVIGEREIITQVRKAFEASREMKLSGDLLRLVIKFTLAAGKRIYTHTHIARNPVSVVSLAWRKVKELRQLKESRVIVIGAGQMIKNLSRFVGKEGVRSIDLYNRTPENATEASQLLNTKCKPLSEIADHKGSFDVLITCTGAQGAIIDQDLYSNLLAGETDKKLIIDLALPGDLDESVVSIFPCDYVGMDQLQQVANDNLALRALELQKCKSILEDVKREFDSAYQQRQLEVALKDIPQTIKQIKETAIGQVFAKELGDLDEQSLEVLHKVMNYMEKKYISVPMKMAREVMIEKIKNN